MPDFNNKKEMLRRLRAKRERNRALWLPCVIAELFVKAWYAVICRAGLALSDKNGRFLGLGAVADKPKKRRQDDIVYVKRPFWGRLLSAALAAAFVMMFVPEMDISVKAADADSYEVTDKDGNTYHVKFFDDSEGLVYKEEEANLIKGYTVKDLTIETGYDSVHVTWAFDETKLNENDGYRIILADANSGKILNGKGEGERLTRLQKEWQCDGLNPKLSYRILVKTYSNIPLYLYTAHEDPDGTIKRTISDDPQNRKYPAESDEVSQTVPAAGKSLTIPKPAKMDDLDGGRTTATIKWSPSSTIGLSGDNTVNGYRVYKWDVNADTYTVLADIPGTTSPGDDGMLSTTDAVTPGGHYRYIIEAYKILWDVNNSYKYDEENPGMITSSEALKKGSLKEKFGSYMTKNDNYTELYVAPNMPDLSLEPAPAQHLINVGWGDKRGSTSDGVFLFRSDHQIRDDEWNSSYDTLTKYLLHIMDTTGELDGVKFIIDPASNVKSYEDKDIVSGQDYWYYVIGYINKSDGTRLYSSPNYKSSNMNLSLDAPQSLKAVTEDGRVTLTWNTVENADGYILSVTKIADNNGKEIPLADRKTLTFNLKENRYVHEEFDGNDLLNGEIYQYYVQAYANVKTSKDDLLVSAPSSTRTVTVGILLDIPQDMLATTQDGMNQIEWSDVDGAEGYILYYSRNGGSWQEVDVSDTGFTHTGLNNNDKYSYYTVAYKTVNGVRVYSDPSVTVSIIVGVPLDAPKDFTGTTEDGIVNLEWSDTEGAEGYILSFRKNGGSWQTVDLSEPGFEHLGLNNGDTYTYYVVAYKNVNGVRIFSKPSNYLTFTIGDELDAPKDFTAVTTDGQVNLSWTASEGAQGYVLYAYGGGRSYQFDLSRTTYLHSGLKNGDTWTYYVVAYKTVNGKRVYSSPTKSITVKIGVSLNAVIDLIATAGNRQVDLEWSDVEGAEGYVVYLYNSKTMEFEPITVVSDTAYSHVGLTNGKKYTYMVAPFKTINGQRFYGEYSMAVDATPTTGSITDIDHALNIKGTTPYGISHSEYISANANHGAFDDSVDVYFTTNKESTKAVKDVLRSYAEGLKSFIIYPFDISVYEEDTLIKVEPNDGYSVTVTMPIPDRLIAYRDYITVVHIGERTEEEEEIDENAADWIESQDGSLEVLPCAVLDIDNVWCVQFVCSNFSPYALVIYKEHIDDVSAGGGVIDGSFAETFNSGVLLFTALPDIMPNNKRLRVVRGGKKRYRIKNIEKR